MKIFSGMPIRAVEQAGPFISEAIINFVANTQEAVILDDAVREGAFTQDTYIIHRQPKSVLCIPLINQSRVSGILYLENNINVPVWEEIPRLQSTT